MQLSVPEYGDEVTADFMTSVLRLAGVLDDGTSVDDLRISKSPKQGLMSTVWFFDVTYSKHVKAPVQFAGKFRTRDSTVPEAVVRGGMKTEGDFLRAVGTSSLPHAATYFIHESAIIMERLEGATLDLFAPMPIARVRAVLKALAGLHAEFWGGLTKFSGSKRDALSGFSSRHDMGPLFEQIVNGPIADLRVTERLLPELSDTIPGGVELMKTRIGGIFRELWYRPGSPITLIFGDIKADNIFVNEATGAFKFVDFAGVGWGCPTDDVSFFVPLTLGIEEYAEEWEGLLRDYHSALVDAGVDSYSFEECLSSYERKVSAPLLSMAIIGGKVEAMKRDEPEKYNSATGAHEQRLFEHITRRVAGAMRLHGSVAAFRTLPVDEEEKCLLYK